MILGHSLLFAACGGLRNTFCSSLDIITSNIFIIIGEMFCALLVWLCSGCPVIPGPIDDNIILGGFYIFLGGFGDTMGQVLFFLACLNISPSSVAAAVQFSCTLLGSLISFAITSNGVVLTYLLVGLGVSFLGLSCLVLAENNLVLHDIYLQCNSIKGMFATSADSIDDQEEDPLVPQLPKKSSLSFPQFWYWTGISLLSGLFFSSLYIVCTVGDTSVPQFIPFPSLVNLIYVFGVFFFFPATVWLSHYFQLLKINDEPTFSSSSNCGTVIESITANLFKANFNQGIAAFLIGNLLAISYWLYFWAVTILPYSISVVIGACTPILTTILSLTIFEDLKLSTVISWCLLLFGSILYALSIYILVFLATD